MTKSKIINYGLYQVDIDYIKYLHNIDNEVFYDASRLYQRKPYIGILIGLGKHKYFIPLTSAKVKHERWEVSDDDHLLVVLKVNLNERVNGDYYKKIDQDKDHLNHILSAIMFSKMIPVKDGLYSYIDINAIKDTGYRDLLRREYQYCQLHMTEILDKATKAYNRQINTSKIRPYYVNYKKLEIASNKYTK